MKPVVIDNFLEEKYCDHILNKYTQNLDAQNVLGSSNDGYRVAEGNWIRDKNDLIIQKYIKSVSEFLGEPVENQETPHLVKYNVGGEYKKHHDFFHKNTDYYESCVSRGGQRKYSCLLYLNDNFTGGETEFPEWNYTVKPKKGSVCFWPNLTFSGELEYNSIHSGLPVISGTKYILIIWIRENKFV